MSSLSQSISGFSLELFKTLEKDAKTSNVSYSPFSIATALSMVLLGARGETAAQMEKVLSIDKMDNVPVKFKALISAINKPGADYILRTANALYGEKEFPFLEEFLKLAQEYFQANLKSVDFSAKSEESRKEINDWVEQKTEGKIKDLLSAGSVNSLTRLVILNAIYFKGNWANKFDPEHTHERPFRLSKNESKPVQMMYKKAKFPMNYADDVLANVISLPYVNSELSMIIILPDDIEDGTTGLEKLERNLTHEKFAEWTDPTKMHQTEVEVSLPKFKLECSYDLKGLLCKMGMTDVFDQSKADLSGISGTNNLVLSKVAHKCYVDVNEEGTEAAGSTAAVIMLRCIRFTPKFTCDHPFLFFIVHKESNSILFCGKFCSP
ncbi:hypothetical protein GDO86_011287 [Hymenochirus boettgeri]|uniref:Serpin B6 n=1 Tax=Hymenochirus boettgeri TaxID=247094 RepID=A0A8T2JFT0_9PIPI|nr:hypothetical protein GDO86_011287 [Hymenochirus boettgeri]